MKIVWKQALGSVALSAVALSMIGTDGAAARNKSSKMEPPPIEKVKPVGDQPVDAPAERGIKDNGVKGCGNCGLTGKEAAPPPVDDGATPPSAEWEDPKGGQHMIRDRPVLAARKKGPKVRDKPASDKTGWIFPTVGALTAATLTAVLVSGNNDDNPTSP